MRRGASALTVNVVGAGTQRLVSGRGMLAGWSLSETAAAASIVTISDGDSAAGPPLSGGIVIAASGDDHVSLSWPVEFRQGLFITTTAGTIVGALHVLLVPDYFDENYLDAVLDR